MSDKEETDPTRTLPARTLKLFVTEVLRRSGTSINVLQVALAYSAGTQRKFPELSDRQLRTNEQLIRCSRNSHSTSCGCQAELALQITSEPIG